MFCKILFGKALFLLPLLYGGHVTASCFGYQAEKISGKALEGHVTRAVNLNEAECNNLCFGTLNCLSINHYAGESDGRQTCELNKASRRVVPSSLVRKAGYNYIEITVSRRRKPANLSKREGADQVDPYVTFTPSRTSMDLVFQGIQRLTISLLFSFLEDCPM